VSDPYTIDDAAEGVVLILSGAERIRPGAFYRIEITPGAVVARYATSEDIARSYRTKQFGSIEGAKQYGVDWLRRALLPHRSKRRM
jgi:hypothetical protein